MRGRTRPTRARGACTAASLATLTLAACSSGGGSGGGGTATFNCRSKCPNDPAIFVESTLCQGTVTGPCASAIAALEQCMSNEQVCNAEGMTDEEATSM